jgi:hypothetical protein
MPLNIGEWQPLNVSDIEGKVALVMGCVPFLLLILSQKKNKILNLLIMSFFFIQSMFYVRMYAIFIVVTIIYSSEYWEEIGERYIWKNESLARYFKIIIAFGIMGSMVVIGKDNLQNYGKINEKLVPVKAVKFLKEQIKEKELVLNNYGWGGYMIYNDMKVFMDGRADVYMKQFNPSTNVFNEFVQTTDLKKLEGNIKKYNIEYIIEKKTDNVVYIAEKALGYKRIYEDDIAVVLKK